VLNQPRSTQRHGHRVPKEESRLVNRMIKLATQYGRYGYRRIAALLRDEGFVVNHKRIERLWRQEGLKVPAKHPKRGRLWLNDGSCVRRRPEYPHHIWSYDFASDRTADGRPFRVLVVVDEYTRGCLTLQVSRALRSDDVLEQLDGSVCPAGNAELSTLRQRAGIHCHSRQEVAGTGQCPNPLYRARVTLGERICGIIHWQTAG